MTSSPDKITSHIPRHVAIIMDGNGRWAHARNLRRTRGHRQGIEAVKRTIEAANDMGIEYLTLFGFSTENWKRPADEVNDLMGLLRYYLRSETAELKEKNGKLRVIGDISRMPADIRSMIEQAVELTAENTGINVTIALSYGGRQDITQAAAVLARQASEGIISPEDITPEMLEENLLTAELPDPDLLIRTSGEYRISNFLLWQFAYAELVFVDTLWPDFGRADLEHAVSAYQSRERRFGLVPERQTLDGE